MPYERVIALFHHFFLQFLHIVEIGQKPHNTTTSRPPVPSILQILTIFNLYSGRPRMGLSVNSKQKVRQAKVKISGGGGTPILGYIRDVRPEWMSFPGQKPADGYKFLTKNLRMGHNFDIILPGNGCFPSKLNKTYYSLVNFYCMGLFLFIDGPALVFGWANFSILWPHTPVQMKLKCPPGVKISKEGWQLPPHLVRYVSRNGLTIGGLSDALL